VQATQNPVSKTGGDPFAGFLLGHFIRPRPRFRLPPRTTGPVRSPY
jgi:hypothetical protein